MIGNVEFNLRAMESNGHGLEGQWNEFQRLNPAHGPVSSEDRSAARAAAVKIMGHLATLQKQADFIEKLTGLLGIAAKPDAKMRPVSSCDEMWRTGKAYTERK